MPAVPRDAAADRRRLPLPDRIAVNAAAVSSILILQTRTFGDVVMTISLIDNLKRHCPDARLAILASPKYEALLKLRPDVEFIPFRRRQPGNRSPFRAMNGWVGAVFQMLARRPDILIDVCDSRTGSTLCALSRAPVRVGFRHKKPAPRRAYTVHADAGGPNAHNLDRYLSPLKALGLPVLNREPHLRATAAAQNRVMRQLADHGLAARGYVAMHVGARVASRQWPPERFAALIDAFSDRHRLRVVLIGGGEDRPIAEAVKAHCRIAPLDRIAALSPEELLAVLTNSRFFLGNDSGPMHLAAASGAPVIALFGLQPPELWGPSGPGHVVVRPPVPCPCPFPGVCRPPDPQETLCVRRIGVEDVLDAAERVLERPA